MKRFFVANIDKPSMFLRGDEHKHLAEVLRAKTGERVIVCPNNGIDYVYEIAAIGRNSTELVYISEAVNDTETRISLTVFFALLKGDKSELVVTKLTELGAKRIVPFISEYTVKTGEKTERLERAALEACKQCGRACIPEIGKVIKLEEIPKYTKQFDKALLAYENAYEGGARLNTVLNRYEKSVALIIGAEGGFSDAEVSLLTEGGIVAITLGKRILRAETASIAAAAVILNICGEWE